MTLEQNTLTKQDLIEVVFEKLGCKKSEASDLIELFFTTLKDALIDGEQIKLSGFGNFQVREKKAELVAIHKKEKRLRSLLGGS